MKKQAADVQANWPGYTKTPSIEEAFTILILDDLNAHYLAFFIDESFPSIAKDARKLIGTTKSYFVENQHSIVTHMFRTNRVFSSDW